MKNFFFASLVIVSIFFGACNSDNSKDGNKNVRTTKQSNEFIDVSKNGSIVIADSLVYTSIIKNPDPADEWMTEWLKPLNINILAESVFSAVYKGKAVAFKYMTNEKMTDDEVKQFDKENTRSEIGKALFIEDWTFNENTCEMGKKVRGIMLAYERRMADSTVSGYKAGIVILFGKDAKIADVSMK